MPDRDPDRQLRRTGTFLGANDGASGVAVLCVLAEAMPRLTGKWGVDFVLFDGEELVYDEQRDSYFLGSTYFAREWNRTGLPFQYRAAVLLDMVGDASLEIYQEGNSMRWRDTRPWVESIWRTAARLQVREFIARRKHTVRDDHVPLHEIAKIPALDIIDFDYPFPGRNYWHTTQDVPENCSALSLAKVGWVLDEWLRGLAQLDDLDRIAQGEGAAPSSGTNAAD
jgi:Zn-dependent M28 family amino/carboxypeptidase